MVIAIVILIVVLVGYLLVRAIHGVRTTFLRDVFVPFGDGLGVFWVVFVRFAALLIVSVPLGGFGVVLIRFCFSVVHFVPIPVGV